MYSRHPLPSRCALGQGIRRYIPWYPDKSAKDNSANDTSAKPTVPNANSAKGSTVRMPTVRMRQRCECQQCECDSSAKDDSPNCAKPFPQLRQLDLDFRQAFLSFFTHLLHTRDRRLASEIPLKLSTLVAVDRLTSFDSVRRRCTKALRKQPVRRIEFSASKRTS